MKRKAFSLVELLVVIAVITVVALMYFSVLTQKNTNAGRSNCQSNLKRIGMAFAQYNLDYDSKFPLTSRPDGWIGLVQPYVNDKEPSPFVCPSETRIGKENLTDYWFNRCLAGVESKKIANPALTLLSGDGEVSDDPNVSLQMLPPRWTETENSPVRRHLDGANYAFADGHVKFFKPKKIVAPEERAQAPTFLLR